jgi:hypothetical protein
VALGVQGSRIRWQHIFLADAYDVVRGDVRRLSDGPGQVDLGPLACLANDVPLAEVTDTAQPDPGAAFFYLVRYRRASTLSEYGWSSGDEVRRSDGEGCPP